VLELAGLLLDFGLTVHSERIGEEAFRQPMPPYDVRRPLMSAWSQLDDQRSIAGGKSARL
jgi:hypothetical protein